MEDPSSNLLELIKHKIHCMYAHAILVKISSHTFLLTSNKYKEQKLSHNTKDQLSTTPEITQMKNKCKLSENLYLKTL